MERKSVLFRMNSAYPCTPPTARGRAGVVELGRRPGRTVVDVFRVTLNRPQKDDRKSAVMLCSQTLYPVSPYTEAARRAGRVHPGPTSARQGARRSTIVGWRVVMPRTYARKTARSQSVSSSMSSTVSWPPRPGSGGGAPGSSARQRTDPADPDSRRWRPAPAHPTARRDGAPGREPRPAARGNDADRRRARCQRTRLRARLVLREPGTYPIWRGRTRYPWSVSHARARPALRSSENSRYR